MSSRKYPSIPEAQEITIDRRKSHFQPSGAVSLEVEAKRVKLECLIGRLAYIGQVIPVPVRIVYGAQSVHMTEFIDYTVTRISPAAQRVEISEGTGVTVLGLQM